MTGKITASIEKYLACIYRLQKKNGVARTSELVKLLGVVPGTITSTMKRLKREGLLTRQPYIAQEFAAILVKLLAKKEGYQDNHGSTQNYSSAKEQHLRGEKAT